MSGIFTPQEIPLLADGRLTLETGVPISTSNQSAKTTVYFTPFNGKYLSLYTNSAWTLYNFTAELSLALGTLTSGKNYDVFVYDNSGTLTLDKLVWTNDTTRATSLAYLDGRYVLNGTLSKLYVGTFRTTATTTTEDSATKRFLYSYYNRVSKDLLKAGSSNWTYATATTRQANADTSLQVEILNGIQEANFTLSLNAAIECDSGDFGHAGIGENDLTTFPFGVISNRQTTGAGLTRLASTQTISKIPRLGYSTYSWNEHAQAGTVTFIGSSGVFTGGLIGSLSC